MHAFLFIALVIFAMVLCAAGGVAIASGMVAAGVGAVIAGIILMVLCAIWTSTP